MENLLRWVNKALLFDMFLVFFFFAWFVVAVVGDRLLNFNLGLGIWQQLWEPIIQPALGIVMAGAILSGVASKFKKI